MEMEQLRSALCCGSAHILRNVLLRVIPQESFTYSFSISYYYTRTIVLAASSSTPTSLAPCLQSYSFGQIAGLL